jgi:glycosyltransferase involved in cell wall biosynthesis
VETRASIPPADALESPARGRSSRGAWPQTLSVVVPVFDEEANVETLVRETVEALRPLGLRFELVLVDDGSRDGTFAALRRVQAVTPELAIVRLRRNFGQTPALQAGIDRARGEVIVTMDGDLQNDPRDIPRLLERIRGGADVVSGWRRTRRDRFLTRTLPSWLANHLIRRVTGVSVHDQGCSLKAWRGDVIRRLHLYSDLHRFIVVLTLPLGAAIEEVEVNHRPRRAGRSKYGLGRIAKVVADLATVRMLVGVRERPTRWFGRLGAPFLGASLACAAVSLWLRGNSVVLPALSLLFALNFAFCVFAGLLGESFVELARRSPRAPLAARESRG